MSSPKNVDTKKVRKPPYPWTIQMSKTKKKLYYFYPGDECTEPRSFWVEHGYPAHDIDLIARRRQAHKGFKKVKSPITCSKGGPENNGKGKHRSSEETCELHKKRTYIAKARAVSELEAELKKKKKELETMEKDLDPKVDMFDSVSDSSSSTQASGIPVAVQKKNQREGSESDGAKHLITRLEMSRIRKRLAETKEEQRTKKACVESVSSHEKVSIQASGTTKDHTSENTTALNHVRVQIGPMPSFKKTFRDVGKVDKARMDPRKATAVFTQKSSGLNPVKRINVLSEKEREQKTCASTKHHISPLVVREKQEIDTILQNVTTATSPTQPAKFSVLNTEKQVQEQFDEHSSLRSVKSYSRQRSTITVQRSDSHVMDTVVSVVERHEESMQIDIKDARENVSHDVRPEAFPIEYVDCGPLQTHHLYVVLDTNVFILHGDFIEYMANGYGGLCLVIPWVVLQELDHLKGASNVATASSARKAVHLISDLLHKQLSNVICQKPQESSLLYPNFKVEVNDDRILQCVLFVANAYGSQVALLTMDENLICKCLCLNKQAFTKTELCSELLIDFENRENSTTNSTSKSDHNVLLKPQAANAFNAVKEMFVSAFSTVLSIEMRLVYDKDWTEIVLTKPPWSYESLLRCMDKHWIAVFSFVLGYKSRDCHASVQYLHHNKSTHGIVENMPLILRHVTVLIESFLERATHRDVESFSHYRTSLNECREGVLRLAHSWSKRSIATEQESSTTSVCPTSHSSSKGSSATVVIDVLSQMCLAVDNSIGLLQNIWHLRPKGHPKRSLMQKTETFVLAWAHMQRHYNQLIQLITGQTQVADVLKDVLIPVCDSVLKMLRRSVKAKEIPPDDLTPTDFWKFVESSSDNRDRLVVGLTQLQELHNKMRTHLLDELDAGDRETILAAIQRCIQ